MKTQNQSLLPLFIKYLILAGLIFLFQFLFWGSDNPLDLDEESALRLERLVQPALGLAIFLLLIQLVFRSLAALFRRNRKIPVLRDNNYLIGLRNLSRIISGVAIVVTVFAYFGIDFLSLLTSLTIVAAALAVTFKDHLGDLISGIFLGFSRALEINDYVKIGDQKGKIVDLGIAKLTLLNDNDDVVLIPNAKVYFSEIINFSRRDNCLLSIDFQLGLSKIEGPDVLEHELIQELSEYSEYIEQDSYNLKIVDVKKDYLDFKFQYRLKDLNRDLQLKIRRKTVRKVLSFITTD